MRFFYFFIFFYLFNAYAYSQNIATFELSKVLNKLESYQLFMQEFNDFKKKKFTELKTEENNLINQKNKIEELKILLSQSEYDNRVLAFEKNKNIFENKVNSLNEYLKTNIESNEKIIFNEIATIVKNIAMENKIDIVLSDDQYYIASENTDISELIYKNLNNIDIILKLSPY